MFWMYHLSPTHETQQAPFRPIPVHIQAQQKHWRCNTHSFAQLFFCLNTVQPHLMANKLLKLDINPRLIFWIVNFLVNHSQTVRHQATVSSSCSVSIGCPQGTVLSPILFTIYINDCTGTDTTPVIKYSDDSAIEIYPTQIVFILL